MILQHRLFLAPVSADGGVKFLNPHRSDVLQRQLVSEKGAYPPFDQLLITVVGRFLHIRFLDIDKPALQKFKEGTILGGKDAATFLFVLLRKGGNRIPQCRLHDGFFRIRCKSQPDPLVFSLFCDRIPVPDHGVKLSVLLLHTA